MPDDVATSQSTDLVPVHLSDRGRDGALKPAQLRAGADIAPVVPTTLEEAYRYAVAIVKAGLAPDSYNVGGNGPGKDDPDPQKVLIGILKSMEVGLPPITGLSTIAIINKRPTIWGDGAVALIQAKGLIERTETFFEGAVEKDSGPTKMDNGEANHAPTLADFSDTITAVYRVWRRGQETPYEGRFSVRDAKRAHLWGNVKRQPWMLYPKRMLMARARAFALRDGFADALSGLSIREEIEDLPPEAPAKTDTSFLDDAPTPAPALAPPAEAPMLAIMPDIAHTEQAPLSGSPGEPTAPPAAHASRSAEGGRTIAPPEEPASPRKPTDYPAYVDALCRWIPRTPNNVVDRHFAENAKALEFVRLNRSADWDRIQAALADPKDEEE